MEATTPASNNPSDPVIIWRPQAGPQTALLTCPVFEIFFGGSRGGGKTDGMLGEWVSHAAKYGDKASGLMVRRNRTELSDTIKRSKRLYYPLAAKFKEQDKEWHFPNGAVLKFAYLENDSDAEAYQGHAYCVAVGTPIRMADGRFNPIEKINPGDNVLTLSGSKKILATTKPYLAPCVRVLVRDDSGAIVGEQIHPVWHPVLTTSGLISSHNNLKRHISWQSLRDLFDLYKSISRLYFCTDRDIPAWYAFSKDDQIYCKGLVDLFLNKQQPLALSVPVVLHAQTIHLKDGHDLVAHEESILSHTSCKSLEQRQRLHRGNFVRLLYRARQSLRAVLNQDRFFLVPSSVLSYAQIDSQIIRDCRADYSWGFYPYGERVRRWLKTFRDFLPLLNDAGNRPPLRLSGVLDTIPLHNDPSPQSWVHPYTGAEHRLLEEVIQGTMEVYFHGMAYVSDISVEGDNHYITQSGLINKNTRVYVEEIGNFPKEEPVLKLMATLRSVDGVPTGFRATGNPGGPGHMWVKARYVDMAPAGWAVKQFKFINPFNDEVIIRDRVYIPSRLSDNPLLMSNDPGYVANLQMQGSAALVKAWLEGDWSVIAGTAFEKLSRSIHMIRPFEIPWYWGKFTSLDWGTAKPYSHGWYTINDDDVIIKGRDGERDRLIAKGSVIRYRELYGTTGKPDEGCRDETWQLAQKIAAIETGEDVDDLIIRISQGEDISKEIRKIHEKIRAKTDYYEKMDYRIADNAMWSEHDGPSAAENFTNALAKCGVLPYSIEKSRKDRTGNYLEARNRISQSDAEHPGFYVFNTCAHFWRTVPDLQLDKKHPEKGPDTNQEDHVWDEVSYSLVSRPKLYTLRERVETAYHDAREKAFAADRGNKTGRYS